MRPPIGSSTDAFSCAVRGVYMESDFQGNIHNYAFAPISGVNRPLQEVNTDHVKFRAGSRRRVHCHA